MHNCPAKQAIMQQLFEDLAQMIVHPSFQFADHKLGPIDNFEIQ
jgi:hypothetical protein